MVQKLLNQNLLAKTVRSNYRKVNIHAIRGGESLRTLRLESKYDTSWSFLTGLRDKGRAYAEEWLETCEPKVGKQSSLDIHQDFLND